MQKYGFTATELDRYLSALLRDSAQLALSSDAISHQQNLEFAMDSIALEHTFTHPSEVQCSPAPIQSTTTAINKLVWIRINACIMCLAIAPNAAINRKMSESFLNSLSLFRAGQAIANHWCPLKFSWLSALRLSRCHFVVAEL